MMLIDLTLEHGKDRSGGVACLQLRGEGMSEEVPFRSLLVSFYSNVED